MSVLIATAKAVDANSYVTVAKADRILGRRLYTAKWDAAATTPSAEGYLVNVGGGAALGASSVVIDAGSGVFTAASKIKFANHDTIYVVSSTLSAPGTLSFSPALTSAVPDDTAVERETANVKEKALIFATTIFDTMLVWNGVKTTVAQSLANPRTGVVDPDGYAYDPDVISGLLEVATCEYALVLLAKDRFAQPAILGQGVSELSLGPLSAKVDSSQQEDVIPQNILAILSPLAYLEPEAQTGMMMVPLVR